jgi:Zinc finger, C3HC4 type (RING finger)
MTTDCKDATICAVCRDVIDRELPEYTRFKLLCGHEHHTACIAQWLIQTHSCPTCRVITLAKEKSTRETQPEYSVEFYMAIEDMIDFFGLHTVFCRLIQSTAYAYGYELFCGKWNDIIQIHTILRWTGCLFMVHMTQRDVMRYSSISPVVSQYIGTLDNENCVRAVVSVIAIALDCARDMCPQWGLWFCLTALGVTFFCDTMTLYKVYKSRKLYTEHVHVNVEYFTILSSQE